MVVERRYATRRAPAPVVNTWQREQNRQVQTALNYFGFPAGAPDGVLGANSRSAIGQYQALHRLSADRRPHRVRARLPRLLLRARPRRRPAGGADHGVERPGHPRSPARLAPGADGHTRPPTAAVARRSRSRSRPRSPRPAPRRPRRRRARGRHRRDQPAEEPAADPAAPAGALPSFLPGASAASIDSYCNRINLATSANGGFVTVAAMNDPGQALGEQFCLARTYAIEQGDSLAGTVQGFSMAEMETQCDAFAPSMTGFQARLAAQEPAEVRAALQDFVSSTGAPPAQMSGSARICLGIGYRTDDAEVALAAALVLVGLGEEAYDELLGHHLMNGFATPKRTDRGLEWLGAASEALAAGANPLVANGSQAHAALLQQAVAELSGAAPGPGSPGRRRDRAARRAGSADGAGRQLRDVCERALMRPEAVPSHVVAHACAEGQVIDIAALSLAR